MFTIHYSGHLLDVGGVGVCLGDICLEGYLPDTPPEQNHGQVLKH